VAGGPVAGIVGRWNGCRLPGGGGSGRAARGGAGRGGSGCGGERKMWAGDAVTGSGRLSMTRFGVWRRGAGLPEGGGRGRRICAIGRGWRAVQVDGAGRVGGSQRGDGRGWDRAGGGCRGGGERDGGGVGGRGRFGRVVGRVVRHSTYAGCAKRNLLGHHTHPRALEDTQHLWVMLSGVTADVTANVTTAGQRHFLVRAGRSAAAGCQNGARTGTSADPAGPGFAWGDADAGDVEPLGESSDELGAHSGGGQA
jgi:hypothetical protein